MGEVGWSTGSVTFALQREAHTASVPQATTIAPVAQQATNNQHCLTHASLWFLPRPCQTPKQQDLEYDNLHNPVNFINKYIVLPKNFSTDDVLSFILDKDDLDEGEC